MLSRLGYTVESIVFSSSDVQRRARVLITLGGTEAEVRTCNLHREISPNCLLTAIGVRVSLLPTVTRDPISTFQEDSLSLLAAVQRNIRRTG